MRRALAAVMIAGLVVGCSDGPPQPSSKQAEIYMQGLGGRGVILRTGTDVNRLYAEAEALKEKGDCNAAIPKLRQVANLGPGYENAQTALGECLFDKAKVSQVDADYLEALTWLSRAADAGWPEAQFEIAFAHAFGPPALSSIDEAGYWDALYKSNLQKGRIGFVPPPPQRVAALEAVIPAAAKAAGEKRALTWQRHVWIPPTPTAAPGPTGRAAQRGPFSDNSQGR